MKTTISILKKKKQSKVVEGGTRFNKWNVNDAVPKLHEIYCWTYRFKNYVWAFVACNSLIIKCKPSRISKRKTKRRISKYYAEIFVIMSWMDRSERRKLHKDISIQASTWGRGGIRWQLKCSNLTILLLIFNYG